MSFCKNCGAELKDDAKFCDKCGTKVEAVAEGGYHEIGYFNELKSFNCHGRLNRARYWKYGFFSFLLTLIVLLVLGILFSFDDATELMGVILMTIFLIAFPIINIPFSIRRLHDLNKSGWFLLFGFIPYVNTALYIYMGIFKGTEGPNQYGPDPLG